MLLLSGCFYNRPIPIEKISAATLERITDDGKELLSHVNAIDNPEELNRFYDIVYATYLDEVNQPEPTLLYEVTLYHEDGSLKVPVFFDLSLGLAFIRREETLYQLPTSTINEWLTQYPAKDLLKTTEMESLTLELNSVSFQPNLTAHWTEFIYDTVGYEQSYTLEGDKPLIVNSFDNSITVKPKDKELSDAIQVKIFQDDTLLKNVTIDASSELPIFEEEGNYRYELFFSSNEFHEEIYTFDLQIDIPTTYAINQTQIKPGDTLSVLINYPEHHDYTVKTTLNEKAFPLFSLDSQLVGLIALDSRTTPGTYQVQILNKTTDTLVQSFDFLVSEIEFPYQNLKFTSSTGSVITQENYDYDNERRAYAYSTTEPLPLWEGAFILPLEGRITTEYATRRFYNNSKTENSRHNALDIAAPTGTPIVAPAHGKVVLAEELKVAGNAIILDHGMGVYSAYYHLNAFHVTPGVFVKQGDLIADVGSTGFSTGPHLHWSIYNNGVYLNPWTMIDADPLEQFNEIIRP